MSAVAFCADRTMEAALHVAASTLLRSLHRDRPPDLYFLLSGFPQRRVDLLRKTLDDTRREYRMHILALPDPALFQGFKPLHGHLAPYHRLILPDLVKEDRLLYLDADTLTRIDVSPLFELDMGGKATGFVIDGSAATHLESRFFLSCGLRPDSPVFNSGVMLFDIAQWKRQQCRERCFEFCRTHTADLKTADQTALNVLFSEDACHLPGSYNLKAYPTTGSAAFPNHGIFHFLGSPKPWDIGGQFLHSSYAMWREASRHVAFQQSAYFSARAWERSLRILPSYKRTIFKLGRRD